MGAAAGMCGSVVECLLSMCETHHYKQTNKTQNTCNKNKILTSKHNSIAIYITLRKLYDFSKPYIFPQKILELCGLSRLIYVKCLVSRNMFRKW